jgi:aldehyde dehydrogenase (NAD+)
MGSTADNTQYTLPGVYVNGRWITSEATEYISVVNPATEVVVGRAPIATKADVDGAVAAANAALPEWSAMSGEKRGAFLEALADELAQRVEELGLAVTRENGAPIQEARAGAQTAATVVRYYGSLAAEVDQEDTREGAVPGLSSRVTRSAIGVAGLIIPWNFPLSIMAMKLGPALAAGCTVVIKPAPETTLHIALVAEAVDAAGLPPGVINFVTGGVSVGQAIVEHPDVHKIGFTGSTAAGREIAISCARQLKSVTLELGGKSAALVLDDVDVEVFRANLFRASLRNTGQTCYAATRLVLPRSRYDELVGVAADVIGSAAQGDPIDEATQVGPVVSERQRDRIEDYIKIGLAEGAALATGGGRPAGLAGYYVEPTLFRDVDPGMRVAREEIFGPVLVAIPYDTEDEGIAIVNDSEYGLAGMVYGSDLERAREVAGRIEAGTVGINSLLLNPLAPFGGWKDSGLGVELGPEAISAYTRYQSVTGLNG